MQGRMKLMNVISCALVFWFKERWNMEVSTEKTQIKNVADYHDFSGSRYCCWLGYELYGRP